MTQRTPGRSRRLTAEQLATWRAFIETSERLRAILGARLQSETGLSPGDYTVLLALSEADTHRMRSSELAEHIGWERSRLSHHLARMERRYLISRDPCAEDSRGAQITTTAKGIDSFRRASIPHLRAVDEMFIQALTPAQLAGLRVAITAIHDHLAERD